MYSFTKFSIPLDSSLHTDNSCQHIMFNASTCYNLSDSRHEAKVDTFLLRAYMCIFVLGVLMFVYMHVTVHIHM